MGIFTLSNAWSAIVGDWNWLLLTRGLCGIGVGGMLGLGRYLSYLTYLTYLHTYL